MTGIHDGDSPNDIAHRLLVLVDRGRAEAITETIDELIPASTGVADLRVKPIVLELLGVAADAARVRAGAAGVAGDDEPYRLEVLDFEGGQLTIDDLGPVPRAALRALMALLAGRDEDAADQVSLVLDNGSRCDAVTLLATCLMWSGTDE